MAANLTLLVVIGCLYAAGVFLLLERSLTRVLLGVLLVGNATNLLLLTSGGRSGGAPIIGVTAPEAMNDPLPHAMILTAIVITLGMTAFLLALIHRGWDLSRRDDDVVDDVEDRLVASRLATDTDEGDDMGPDDGEDPDAASRGDETDDDEAPADGVRAGTVRAGAVRADGVPGGPVTGDERPAGGGSGPEGTA